MNKQEFIDEASYWLEEFKKDYPWLKVSMGVAQGGRESGWGKHSPGNNFLGIKAPKIKKGDVWIVDPKIPVDRIQKLRTWEWSAKEGKFVQIYDWFMNYPSLRDCFERYVKILDGPRYKQTRESKDWWDSTNYVRLNGYATSPGYTDSLRTDILQNKLYELDWVHDYNDPIRPGYNFTWGETFSDVYFKGRHYIRVIEPYPELWLNVEKQAEQLQVLRYWCGTPIICNEWFRIPDTNAHVGGSSLSRHKTADATDLPYPKGKTRSETINFVKTRTSFKGIGYISNRSIHLDTREGKLVEWNY